MDQMDYLVQINGILQTHHQTLTDGIQEVSGSIPLISTTEVPKS